MMETFKVGDKAEQTAHGKVEITYGPFTGSFGQRRYLVRIEDGREYAVATNTLSAIPEPPKFAVGDKVKADNIGLKGSLVAGPFMNRWDDEPFWVVEHPDGKHTTPREHILTKANEAEPIKVGDRVRVLRATFAEDDHGQAGTITSTSETWRERRGDTHPYSVKLDRTGGEIYVAEVERIDDPNTYAHGGVTYDLSARYRDRDGDEWKFARIDGEVHGDFGEGACPTAEGRTLRNVVAMYGPLTRT
ncbi:MULTISPECIES: phiSA1p31-related protein [unclassified Streptomyces]|uniref:phiSA1p31-related protein n=1 Tax=unclassified Streptomyces TaxID=2593676 RepID=UPI0036E6BA36